MARVHIFTIWIYWHFNKPKDDKLAHGAYTKMWRLHENKRKANVYPTHGLGPICQAMTINRGDKMEYLTAMMGNDFTLKTHREGKRRPVF